MSNAVLLLSFLASRSFGAAAFVQNPLHRKLFHHNMKTLVKMGYPTLDNKTLVSVQDCLEAFCQHKDKRENDNGSGGVVFVDASWYHKCDRCGRSEFEQGPRITGSKYIDMDDISTSKELFPHLNPKGLPHMLPTKELFAAAMDSFHISNDDHVVVYGRKGSVFTPRTWYLFRAMGHDASKIHLMQGPMEEWGGDMDKETTVVIRAKDLDLTRASLYQARNASNVCDMKYVMRNVVRHEIIEEKDGDSNRTVLLVDSRGSSFAKGHIPGAIHIPYSSLVRPDNALAMKTPKELQAIFRAAGVDPLSDLTTILCSCGSGVSVCHLVLAMEECGRDTSKHTLIYDGSWAEWGRDPETPKVVLNVD